MQAVRRTRQHELKSYFRLIDSNGVISSKSESESDDREEGKMCDGIDVDDSLDDSVTSKSRPIRFEDVKEITICRSKLAKWFMEPFFEEIIVGCFVRIGIGRTRNGPKYKLCVVKNVDATNPNRKYKIEDRTTCKWLNCVWGNEAFAARWQMAMVSNHPPTEQEFKEWLGETERCERDIPCRQYVHDKIEEIKKTSAFICSLDTMKDMLKPNKLSSSRPFNVAIEKVFLKKEIAKAESCGKKIVAEKLRAKLKEMEDLSRQVKPPDARAIKLVEMNNENRIENYKNAANVKPFDASLNFGETGYDPFSRRWTRPTNHDFNTMSVKGNVVDTKYEKVNDATTMDVMKKNEGGSQLIDDRTPVDYGARLCLLHNFDLIISVASLNKSRGVDGIRHCLMERKQKIEAKFGYRVSDDYGRNHFLTLNVNDYKRRRGLL